MVGISELSADRARRRSVCGASTITWVLVTSWIVVIAPRLMPILLVQHLDDGCEAVRGARCSGHDVVERRGSYRSSLHPITMFRTPSDFTGAATITLRTPCSKCGSSVFGRLELAAAVEDDVDVASLPRDVAGRLWCDVKVTVSAVDVNERRTVGRHVAGVATVDGVELEEMGDRDGVGVRFVDVNQFDVVAERPTVMRDHGRRVGRSVRSR